MLRRNAFNLKKNLNNILLIKLEIKSMKYFVI